MFLCFFGNMEKEMEVVFQGFDYIYKYYKDREKGYE